ncbi:Cytochrome P450 CYP4 [Frankliniella occidentalis]|uniref:Cytochrome P450 4g15-like n=1 Tax=Frankliniella occidentalis TaxID=133901 RepID=A0A9C6XBC8_FRAOC|nr:cytochrome P450 4g15-like [Frankliniella occidentalis]KAE8736685.1 Cytochrome P450 CYP4 [Frankliniella occidentalis]
MRKVAADIPGPPGLPLIGNLLDVVSGGDDRIYDNICRLMDRWGPTVGIWLGPELVVSVADPRDVEYVSTSNELIDKSPFYGVLEPLLGSGLSCLGGQEVRRHRKIVMPSLHLDILHDFLDTFQSESLRFAARLEQHADDGQDFDVAPLCVEYSLAAALQTIMSSELEDGDDAERLAFGGVLQSAMDLFMYRVWRPWFLHDALFRLSSRRPEYVRTMTALNGFTEGIITKKRRKLAERRRHQPHGEEQSLTAAPTTTTRRRRRAFLDNILDNEEGAALTDLELRDEVKTLLCTGSETSASTLSFVIAVLALRQDVQAKVVQELDDVFGGDASRPVTLEELPHLQYLERVVRETLRLFPVLPFFTRSCPRDVQLPSGYTAPRGAHLTFFLPALHTCPRTWPDPRRFDPDRFLPENSRGRHPFSYLPFSAGPRNCVGQRYAMMLLKVEVATLLRRFHILPAADGPAARDVADLPIKVTLVIAVKGGVRVRLRRRTAPCAAADTVGPSL